MSDITESALSEEEDVLAVKDNARLRLVLWRKRALSSIGAFFVFNSGASCADPYFRRNLRVTFRGDSGPAFW